MEFGPEDSSLESIVDGVTCETPCMLAAESIPSQNIRKVVSDPFIHSNNEDLDLTQHTGEACVDENPPNSQILRKIWVTCMIF